MNPVQFKVGGPLTDDHADIYVSRPADGKALSHLRAMEYLLLIEPRQQGKTSLINHLMCHTALSDMAFAYVDVSTPNHSTDATWYQTLCPRILRQLRGFIPHDQWPAIPQNSTDWREFLCNVATLAADAQRRVVIALDEIGAVTFPGATEFFSVLRDVYNSRQAETELKQLTFLLAGAFHPRDLIQDDKISPFNIAQRVRLCDFDRQSTNQLVKYLFWNFMDTFQNLFPDTYVDEITRRTIEISDRIAHWVGGQPYLTQWICNYLTLYGPAVKHEHVDEAVERLRRDDDNHLPHILERLKTDEKPCNYLEDIVAGEQIKFYPREHRRQADLELLGVIKEGPDGFCVIRNRIYKQVLPQALENPETSQTADTNDSGENEEEIIMSQRNPPRSEIEEVLNRGSLALFLGADLSREITGLPSRADLARDLARRKGLDTSLSLAEVAQRVARGGNRWDFTAFIRDQLDTTGKPPQPFHRRMVNLVRKHQVNHIITTAYDNLLEMAFQEEGIPINCVVRGSDVSFIAPDRPTLIKLYGDAQQPDTLVVTEDDHYGLGRDRDKEDLLHEVRTVLRRQTVLFLGYNLADPDFNLLWREVLDRAGCFNRTAYAVWPGLPEDEVRVWRDRGIVILDTDPLGILDELETPSSPAGRSEPQVGIPKSESSVKGNDMDYERGLDTLKQLAEGADWHQDFTVHEAPLRENLRDERRYGPSEQTRRDRTRIVDQLNALALKHLGISFNDLCMGKQPPPQASTETKGNSAPTEPEQLYGTGQAWAVLVGVNEYDDKANYGELQVCVKDVEAVHEQLVASGFDSARIRLLTDHTGEPPTRANILTALKAVADATEPDDLLLFYYSGHGEEDGGESYLVAREGRRLVLGDTAVSLSRVKEIVEEAPARAKVIVLDACHSGADIGGKGAEPMSEAFIRRVFEEAEGMAILASCKQGQLSYEWRDNERSVFTHFLLEALAGAADWDEKGFVTVQDASRHVTNGVKLWASQRNTSQIPTLQYTVAGDIILSSYAAKRVSNTSPSLIDPMYDTICTEKDASGAKAAAKQASLATPSTLRLSRIQKREVVKALLACPTMQDRHIRDTIVSELSDDIRTNIRRSSVDRVDVTNIVSTCVNYAEGLTELVESIQFYEGDSMPMQRLVSLRKRYGF